jgi:hypothetical protein
MSILVDADLEPIECCEEGQFISETQKTEEEIQLCNPIAVPRGDVLPTRCINFVRSVAIDNLECSGGPIEQLNQITHWLDSSNIYGSLPTVAASVRSFKDGLLATIIGEDGQEQLPVDPLTNCTGTATGTCGLAGNFYYVVKIFTNLV